LLVEGGVGERRSEGADGLPPLAASLIQLGLTAKST
jgi:hypothetical protein